MPPYFDDMTSRLEIPPSFIFARLVPGSSVVAAINWRVLCDRCEEEEEEEEAVTVVTQS